MTLGELLRSRRLAMDLSIRDVASLADVTASHLCGIELDKHEPGICLCGRLSVVLGVSVQQMAGAALSTQFSGRVK